MGDLFFRAPAEEAQFYNLGLAGIVLKEPVECLIDRQQLTGFLLRAGDVGLQRNPIAAAGALRGLHLACVVDQNPAHKAGRHAEEMSPTLPIHSSCLRQRV